ncbi:hypothetical protein NPIL_426441 [Nephila pilipes]|uniref:Uncharacterized protein n=1 Tax=Nephila pilipes TaxID=299642 RepID=A0A8X6U919_NEPPI|nr:hypothetical protein NPIL_426441 [Nephila pilipes]
MEEFGIMKPLCVVPARVSSDDKLVKQVIRILHNFKIQKLDNSDKNALLTFQNTRNWYNEVIKNLLLSFSEVKDVKSLSKIFNQSAFVVTVRYQSRESNNKKKSLSEQKTTNRKSALSFSLGIRSRLKSILTRSPRAGEQAGEVFPLHGSQRTIAKGSSTVSSIFIPSYFRFVLLGLRHFKFRIRHFEFANVIPIDLMLP